MKVAVVGGSIAGLESAIRLSDFCDVTVFEEHSRIGYPIRCAEGWISAMVKPYIRGKKIRRAYFRLLSEDMKVVDEVEVRCDGVIEIVDRVKLESRMAEMAQSKGCKIVLGEKVKIRQLLNYDLIVDASGHPSQYDREFGIKRRGGVALQAFVKEDVDDIYIDIYPKVDGYIWVFPDARGGAKVGTGFYLKHEEPLRKILNRYIEKHGFTPKSWTAGLLGVGINKPLVRMNGKVCLVGDSAGLVDKFFAEGMTKAVLSARIMAECAKRNIFDYEKELMKRLRWHYIFTDFMYWLKRLSPKLTLRFLKMMSKFNINGRGKRGVELPWKEWKIPHKRDT